MFVSRILSVNVVRRLREKCISSTIRRLSSQNVLHSDLPDVEIPKISIPELIFSKCEKFGDFVATECGVTGRKFTYRDVRTKAGNLAKALRGKLKLAKGDVIGLLLPNVPEFPIAALGALEAGLVVTTFNPIYTAEEISRQLLDSTAKALITLNELWDVADASQKLTKTNLLIITIKTDSSQAAPVGAINFQELTDNADVGFGDLKPGDPENLAFLPYSSGTTGLPKGVQLTHRNIVANLCQNLCPDLGLYEEANSSHQDVIPGVLPMFHIYGLNLICLTSLVNGCKVVTLPKFTTDWYVSVLKDHKPDLLFVVPPIVLFLAGHPSVKPKYLASTRLILSGAAPLGALDEQRLLEKVGHDVCLLQGYGLTESSPTVAATTKKLKEETNVDGSIGRPIPNTAVKIVAVGDATGTPLGPNESGELMVRGPQVMRGYLNRPEETQNTFLDGWLRTGDLAHYNDDNIIFVTDRLKELIKVKGFQVAPAELEEILRNVPGVADAAVIGVPDPISGEVPRAYVVPKNGAKLDEHQLKAHVAQKVASFKRLMGGVAIVETIPKNLSGKILRRQLKLTYEQEGR